jgi:hypothetical protein
MEVFKLGMDEMADCDSTHHLFLTQTQLIKVSESVDFIVGNY